MTVLVYTPWLWYLLLLPVIALSVLATYYLKLHCWQSLSRSVLEINQDADKQWALLVGEKWHLVDLLPNSFVSTWLVVMNFKGKAGRFTVVLPADSLDEDTFRRLRVRVRIEFSGKVIFRNESTVKL